MPSRVSENSRHTQPSKLVTDLALRKARVVERRLVKRRLLKRHLFVLGADTVVVLKNKIIGKPRDSRHAYEMLYQLSGTTHRVFTGVALVDASSGRAEVSHAVSKVKMKKMALEALMKLSRKHLDKAGSYAIQEKRDPIARVVSGSYDNVVGLPLELVRKLIRRLDGERRLPKRRSTKRR